MARCGIRPALPPTTHTPVGWAIFQAEVNPDHTSTRLYRRVSRVDFLREPPVFPRGPGCFPCGPRRETLFARPGAERRVSSSHGVRPHGSSHDFRPQGLPWAFVPMGVRPHGRSSLTNQRLAVISPASYDQRALSMSRRCEITGKGVLSGNNVSHANNKTRRRFLPNLQVTSLLSEALGQTVRLRLSTRAIRTIEHNGGIDAFLLGDQRVEADRARAGTEAQDHQREGEAGPPLRRPEGSVAEPRLADDPLADRTDLLSHRDRGRANRADRRERLWRLARRRARGAAPYHAGRLAVPLRDTLRRARPRGRFAASRSWPRVPAGFTVSLFASGLEMPRTLRTAPDGDCVPRRKRRRPSSACSRANRARTNKTANARPESSRAGSSPRT